MELKFEVHARIARPPGQVFEAVADPDQLSRYFTTGGAKGRLETGAIMLIVSFGWGADVRPQPSRWAFNSRQ
jgi:uncharacterized protein YndB with AHSA1/START domain